MSTEGVSHPDLRNLQKRLQKIYEDISNFQPSTVRYPILDSSLDINGSDSNEDGPGQHWSQQDHISGLKKLKESLKIDLDGLQKVSCMSSCNFAGRRN